MARVRMGAMAVAFGIQHDLDLECLVHFTTRDRNLMAIESELLGAHALGVRNILALTGDPPRIGDYPSGTGIWDIDSIGLVGVLARLNRGEDQAGKPIGAPAGFTIACALDPTAADTDRARPARGQARGRRAPDHDPAHLRASSGTFHGPRRGGALGQTGCRGRCCSVSCRCTRRAMRSSCTTRFRASRSPTRSGHAWQRRVTGGGGGHGDGDGAAHADAPAVEGTYIMPSFGRYEQCAGLVRRIRSRLGAAILA